MYACSAARWSNNLTIVFDRLKFSVTAKVCVHTYHYTLTLVPYSADYARLKTSRAAVTTTTKTNEFENPL